VQNCLGIYVEDNLIKYAKVSKEKDSIKVEAFNVEFFENLGETLNRIIKETNSEKVPISMNVSNELYNYFDIFSMLSKQDAKKSVDIEFETICASKQYNMNSLETRFALIPDKKDKERLNVLHIATNQVDMNKKAKELGRYKISSLMPISTSIVNLLEVKPNDNMAIINIENEVKITIIMDGQIVKVDVLEEGMGTILNEINQSENSMKKSYDLCKNMTIYGDTTGAADGDYSGYVVSALYKMVADCKKIIDDPAYENIDRIYISGLGIVINNIDLYFQEYFPNMKCEILKPFFIEGSSVNIPVKEYLEVNSAIALALDGVGYKNKDLDFVSSASVGVDFSSLKNLFRGGIAFEGPFQAIERLFMRMITGTVILLIGFISVSTFIAYRIDVKTEEVDSLLLDSQAELKKVQEDINLIDQQNTKYQSWIDSIKNLEKTSEEIQQGRIIDRYAIPNLLTKIGNQIPEQVTLLEVYNDENDHIVIKAESERYEQLGYFKAIIETKGILTNVKATSGIKEVTDTNEAKENVVVTIVIEGDLP